MTSSKTSNTIYNIIGEICWHNVKYKSKKVKCKEQEKVGEYNISIIFLTIYLTGVHRYVKSRAV